MNFTKENRLQKWIIVETMSANLSWLSVDIEDFLNITDDKKVTENDTSWPIQNIQTFEDLNSPIMIFAFFPLVLSIFLQFFAIKYERTEMDPMKRGLKNQVG